MKEKKAAGWCFGIECGGSDCLSESYMNAGKEKMRPSLLLHSCCGPCSTSVIERLAPDYEITVFYYNPCITDNAEYIKRRDEQIRFINEYNASKSCVSKISFMEGKYDPERYLEIAAPFADEPEGGKRCSLCFRMRLEETARVASEKEFRFFTTTLTVSPHKNYQLISGIGKEMAEKYKTEFLDMDFKKKAGFQRSVQLSREYSLYRQNFCGCEFSRE